MHPLSRHIIGQILNPRPMGGPGPAPDPSALISLGQIVQPESQGGTYTGPERRVQGYLIAETIEEAPRSNPPAEPDSLV